MIRRWLAIARMRAPAPLAGIVAVLCGLGVVASALGSAETVFRTVRLQTVRPADEPLPHAGDRAAWVRPCITPIRQAPACDAVEDEGVQEDWEARDRPTPTEEPFSRRDGLGIPLPAWPRTNTDVRDQLMGAANLARHRVEPWAWTTRNEPGPPLRYGDQ